MLTTTLAMSMCSSQRMENRLGRGVGEMRWRWGEWKEEERMEEGERTAEEREGWGQLLARV